MLQSTRTGEEPPMAMVRTALEVGRLLWQSVSSVLRHERAFLAFECKKAFEICTCMRELDTDKYQVPAPQIWTSLQPDRLRMAELSHTARVKTSPIRYIRGKKLHKLPSKSDRLACVKKPHRYHLGTVALRKNCCC
jgi:hypothetical protein